jgi:hypothetical protein
MAAQVEPVDHVVEVALSLGLRGEVLLPLPLVEQLAREQVAVGVALGVEPGARIPVPVPRAADAAARLDELRREAGLACPIELVKAGDAGPHDEHLDVRDGSGRACGERFGGRCHEATSVVGVAALETHLRAHRDRTCTDRLV